MTLLWQKSVEFVYEANSSQKPRADSGGSQVQQSLCGIEMNVTQIGHLS